MNSDFPIALSSAGITDACHHARSPGAEVRKARERRPNTCNSVWRSGSQMPNLAQQFDRAHERTSDQASTSLVRTAYLTRPAVEFTLSLRMAAARCVSVVLMLRSRIALTPLLLCPSATNLTIVFSRGESTWFGSPFPLGTRPLARWKTSQRRTACERSTTRRPPKASCWHRISAGMREPRPETPATRAHWSRAS